MDSAPTLVFRKSDIFTIFFFHDHVGFAKTLPEKVKDDIGHGIYAERYEDGWYIIDKTTNYRIYYGKKRLMISQLFKEIARRLIDYIQKNPIWEIHRVKTVDGNVILVRFNKFTTTFTENEIISCKLKEISDKDLSKLYNFTEYGFTIDLSSLSTDIIRFCKANR